MGVTWSATRLAAGLAMVIAVASFEGLAVPLLAGVDSDFSQTNTHWWVFSTFMISSMAGIIVARAAVVRYGPAGPLSLGLGLLVSGLLVTGLASSFGVVISGRALQGLGAGAVPPVAYFVAGKAWSDNARPRVFALFAGAWLLPGLLPWLFLFSDSTRNLDFAIWRQLFIAPVPLVVLAVVLTVPPLRAMPRGTRDAWPDMWDRPGQMVTWAAVAGAVLALLDLLAWARNVDFLVAGVIPATAAGLAAALPDMEGVAKWVGGCAVALTLAVSLGFLLLLVALLGERGSS